MTHLLGVFISHHCTNQRFPLVRRLNILLNIKNIHFAYTLDQNKSKYTYICFLVYNTTDSTFQRHIKNQYTLKSHILALIESNLAIINHNNTSVKSKHKRHQLSVSTALNQITEVKLYKLQSFTMYIFFVSFQGWAIHSTPSTQFFTLVLLYFFDCHATQDSENEGVLGAHGTPSEQPRILFAANFLSVLGIAGQHRAKFALSLS